MAHIALPDGLPGISGPLAAYPDTARHLLGLAQTLLRGPSSLTPAERELIATYTSRQNECRSARSRMRPRRATSTSASTVPARQRSWTRCSAIPGQHR